MDTCKKICLRTFSKICLPCEKCLHVLLNWISCLPTKFWWLWCSLQSAGIIDNFIIANFVSTSAFFRIQVSNDSQTSNMNYVFFFYSILPLVDSWLVWVISFILLNPSNFYFYAIINYCSELSAKSCTHLMKDIGHGNFWCYGHIVQEVLYEILFWIAFWSFWVEWIPMMGLVCWVRNHLLDLWVRN